MDGYSFDCSLCVKDGSFDIVEGLNSSFFDAYQLMDV